jgi:hypothetical protein
MNRILERPQFLFFALIPIVLILGFMIKDNSITINIHEIYIVLEAWIMCLYAAVFFLMIGLNYSIISFAKKKPRRKLTVLHIVLQVLALIVFLYIFSTAGSLKSYEEEAQLALLFLLSFLVFLIATLLHFINLIVSFLRKKE